MDLPNPPAGGYKTIVIDPPWPAVGGWGKSASKGNRYERMTTAEIKGLRVDGLAAEQAHLFLWATQRFLPMAFDLLPWYGFRYQFTMVWHKPSGHQIIGYPKYNCEFVVYGHKGKMNGGSRSPGFLDTKDFPACFNAPRGRHSEKPGEFYELLRRVTPGPRIDLFARRRHEGFDAWGNEVEEGRDG